METPDRIPFPERIITLWDIAKGVGQVVLHTLFDQIHHDPSPAMSDHWRPPEV